MSFMGFLGDIFAPFTGRDEKRAYTRLEDRLEENQAMLDRYRRDLPLLMRGGQQARISTLLPMDNVMGQLYGDYAPDYASAWASTMDQFPADYIPGQRAPQLDAPPPVDPGPANFPKLGG